MATQSRVGWKPYVNLNTATYLLDTYGGAAAAYSLRKLKSDYTGPAIRVRRSSDNTSQDIGFNSNGNLDTNALLNFIGGFNVLQYSENFENAYWSKTGVSVTTDQVVAPDGTTTADLITETGSSSYHVFGRFGASSTWTSGTSYNTSVYIKRTTDSNSPTRVALAFDYGTSAVRPYVIFNIENGTVASHNFFTDTNTGYSITDSGNGWWRISMWGTLTSSRTVFGSGGLIRFNNNLDTISTLQYTAVSGSSVYLWGYQLNQNSTTEGLSLQPYSKTSTIVAGDGYVTTWYDQSGNTNDRINTTAAQQPQIVSKASVITSSGKPTMFFDGSNDNFINQNPVLSGISTTIFSVFQINSAYSTANEYPIFGATSPYGTRFSILNNKYFVIDNTVNTGVSSTSNIYTGTNVATTLFSTTDKMRVNGAEVLSGSAGNAGSYSNLIGKSYLGKVWYGNMSEIVIYTSDKTSDFNAIESNINTYYTIY
jgi:hypothetical protein